MWNQTVPALCTCPKCGETRDVQVRGLSEQRRWSTERICAKCKREAEPRRAQKAPRLYSKKVKCPVCQEERIIKNHKGFSRQEVKCQRCSNSYVAKAPPRITHYDAPCGRRIVKASVGRCSGEYHNCGLSDACRDVATTQRWQGFRFDGEKPYDYMREVDDSELKRIGSQLTEERKNGRTMSMR